MSGILKKKTRLNFERKIFSETQYVKNSLGLSIDSLFILVDNEWRYKRYTKNVPWSRMFVDHDVVGTS